MNPPGDQDKLPRLSQRVYEHLLAIYPRSHCEEYGAAMTQLFRDQCRDAWHDAGRRGLLLLWLHILPDLLKTSCLEHLASLKGKKHMTNKLATGVRSPSAARTAFLVVFLVMFGMVFVSGIVITYMLPEVYASRARIKLERDSSDANGRQSSSDIYDPYFIQTEFEVIQSEIVLDKVIDALNLNEVWSKKYGSLTKFKTSESRQALRRMIDLRPVRNTSLIDVTVYSDDRIEAARIANAVVEAYQTVMKTLAPDGVHTSTVTIIEHAEPSARPVRPNKPLNIFLSGCFGILAGLVGGGIAAFVVSRLQISRGNLPPPVPAMSAS